MILKDFHSRWPAGDKQRRLGPPFMVFCSERRREDHVADKRKLRHGDTGWSEEAGPCGHPGLPSRDSPMSIVYGYRAPSCLVVRVIAFRAA